MRKRVTPARPAAAVRALAGVLRQLSETGSWREAVDRRAKRVERRTKSIRKDLRRVDRRIKALTKAVNGFSGSGRVDRPTEQARDVGRLDYAPVEILLRTASRVERSKRLRSCEKEPWTVQWIEDWLAPGETLYDVGANVGAYSLIAAKASGGAAHVVALEPGFATFASLCENVILNNAEESITPLPIALSDRTQLSVLEYRDLRPGGSKHTVGDGSPAGGERAPSAYRQPILVWSLDDLVERFGLPLPDHMKVDVDGPELAVITGSSRILAAGHVKSLLVEMDQSHAEQVVDALEASGYALGERFSRPHAQAGSPWYGLFTPAR